METSRTEKLGVAISGSFQMFINFNENEELMKVSVDRPSTSGTHFAIKWLKEQSLFTFVTTVTSSVTMVTITR